MKNLHTHTTHPCDNAQPPRSSFGAHAQRGVFSTAKRSIVARPNTAPAKRGVSAALRNTPSSCETRGLREDSRVTGIWRSATDASPWSCQIPAAIRRPLKGAEYTVGRVLVESLGATTTRTVRKRGLEPPRPCGHMNLNHARLPIPPLPHDKKGEEQGEILFALDPVKPGSSRVHRAQAASDCIASF